MLNGRMELPIGPLRGGWAALRVMRKSRRFRPQDRRDDGARARGALTTAADVVVGARFLLNGEDGGDGQEGIKRRRRRMSRKNRESVNV